MEITIILISILFSAFCSGMEIAFVSSNRMEIELERKKQDLVTRLYIFLADHPKSFISSILIGNTIALVVYSKYCGELLVHFIERFVSLESHLFVIVLQTFISTIIILVTGEFLPKAIFSINPNKFFKFFSIPAYLIYLLMYPLSKFVESITNLFLKILNKEGEKEDDIYLKEELSYFISEKIDEAEEGELDTELQFFQNALHFSEMKARDCMVPRKEIKAVGLFEEIETVKQTFITTGLSKIVIYKENIDNIIGYVHAFDMFKKPTHVGQILLPIEIVHETTAMQEVMNRLTKKRKSLAIVLDEYGGTAGLITLEDIVEELFGDIEDEHDKSIYEETKISEKEYLFSARLEIDYLNEEYGLDLPESSNYETLGGLIVSIHEDIPEVGEEIELNEYRFVITKVSTSRIEEIRLFREAEY